MTAYMPTMHAIDRARLRFGIGAESVTEWINAMMDDAKYLTTNPIGQLIYDSEGVRIVVDPRNNAVVTLYDEVKTDFLRPILEREMRKLKREYTRAKRSIELKYAKTLQELADMAINRAKARNPQTRELISERMTDKQAEIDEFVRSIERMDDEYKAKIRAIELIAE